MKTLKIAILASILGFAAIAAGTFENINLNQPTYSETDPLGVSAITNIEFQVTKLVSTNELSDVLTNFVKFTDMDGITIDGKKPSLEGHKHDMSDITNLVFEASVPDSISDASVVATNAIQKATTIAELKTALNDFIKSFQK